RLAADPDADALREQAGEDALERDRLAADVEQAPCQPEEGDDDAGDADEAELLADHREQEVGVRLGQVVQLLDARAEALAEDLAAAERDQRMRQLVRLAERVLLVPRVEVREDALAAPLAEGD